MSNRQITIAIDAMGGENSPYKILKGTEIFTSKYSDVKIVFFGNKISIEKIISKKKINLSNFEILNTSDDVQDADNTSTILRNRKESSIYKGLEIVKTNINSSY